MNDSIYIVERVEEHAPSTRKDVLGDRETAIEVARALAEKYAAYDSRGPVEDNSDATTAEAVFDVDHRRWIVVERDPSTVSANVDVDAP
jgi:hypothetical protein